MSDEFYVKKRDGVRDYRKCPAHNFWMCKGSCELCLLEREKQRKEYEKTGGSNKPPVVIKKV
jgi:hypothetical protein